MANRGRGRGRRRGRGRGRGRRGQRGRAPANENESSSTSSESEGDGVNDQRKLTKEIEKMTDTELMLMAVHDFIAADKDGVSRRDIMDKLGYHIDTSKSISKLMAEGKIARSGRGGGEDPYIYKIVGAPPTEHDTRLVKLAKKYNRLESYQTCKRRKSTD